MPLIHDHLARRVRSDPSTPLLTHYSDAGRTELSARSFANWVDKTANLMLDELDLAAGDRVRLTVAEEHPGHWMTLVWAMACWQAGLVVSDRAPDLEVTGPVGPVGPQGEANPALPTISCSLHPLALPQRELPAGVLDFSAEALPQPDAFLGVPATADDPALELDGQELDQQQLTTLEVDADFAERQLVVNPEGLWQALTRALLVPLLTGGSRVVVELPGVEAARLDQIAADERADLS